MNKMLIIMLLLLFMIRGKKGKCGKRQKEGRNNLDEKRCNKLLGRMMLRL